MLKFRNQCVGIKIWEIRSKNSKEVDLFLHLSLVMILTRFNTYFRICTSRDILCLIY